MWRGLIPTYPKPWERPLRISPDGTYHPVALSGCLHLFHCPLPTLFSLVNSWAPTLPGTSSTRPPWSLRLPSLLCTCTCRISTCLSELPWGSIHGPQDPKQHWPHDKITVNYLGRQMMSCVFYNFPILKTTTIR